MIIMVVEGSLNTPLLREPSTTIMIIHNGRPGVLSVSPGDVILYNDIEQCLMRTMMTPRQRKKCLVVDIWWIGLESKRVGL